MCSQRPPHSGERRKPPHHDSLLNQLICSPLLGGFGRSKLRKLHMACRSYAWLLAGQQSQGSENNYFEKMIWEMAAARRNYPVHLIEWTTVKHIYKPSHAATVSLDVLCPQFWLNIIDDQNRVVLLYRCYTGPGCVGECSDNLCQLNREPPDPNDAM